MAKKKVTGEDGKTYVMKEKKPFYKKVWFWMVVVILVFAVGGALGGSDNKDSATSNSATDKSEKTDTTKTEENKSENLTTTFDNIKIGDIMSNGDGGSTIEEVKQSLGEPSSTSETNIEGYNAKALTWSSVEGGDMLSSIVVSFSNDRAVSKAVTGLKVPEHEKATLEQFNAVATDGTYTEEQARIDFGDPDGISTSLINGERQNLLSWTKNIEGDLGANFNITFDNGTATSKSQMSMK
ncbi:DUF3862 domain-containing protein [Enterococcus mundtii]|uniref:DUF3862 domain-containing protein n=1 Tax=Enterococcus mundtii TaxID=53346 RepID=UPI001CCC3658|nr:DUF3862 domain-containing protein [Enterococcus mundtii]UBM06643.1 DUF3862 domain-containing protein [Enterococcus mundtii]